MHNCQRAILRYCDALHGLPVEPIGNLGDAITISCQRLTHYALGNAVQRLPPRHSVRLVLR